MSEEIDDLKETGRRIQAVRKHLGMSQDEFARALNMSSGSISMMESGKNQPRFELLSRLAKRYRISLNYLFFGEGDMVGQPARPAGGGQKKYGDESESWLERFYYYFNESQIFRFWIMFTMHGYLAEHRELIEKEIRSAKEEKDAALKKI